jgi:pimeloyl-ACP methyl ester carboxylesterase
VNDQALTSVRLGSFTFDVRKAGPADGPPVVLLHGFPETSWSWRHQIDVLATAGHRVIAPDQRGYSPGARPPGRRSYRMAELVGDVMRLADHEDLGRFHLVGHDWGAAVAWMVASAHADRLRSLTAISVPHPLAYGDAIRKLRSGQAARSIYFLVFQIPGIERLMLARDVAGFRSALQRSGLSAEEADHYGELMSDRAALTAALNWYRAVWWSDVKGLEPVTVPTLHLWSTGDPALSRTGAEQTEKYVAGPYRFEVLEGISHWIPEHAPETTNQLLLEHFAAHPD